MSYANIATGYAALFAGVTGITTVCNYEPTTVQDSPLVFSQMTDFELTGDGTAVTITWRTMHRLCIRWQDSAECESTLRALADAIVAAWLADANLGGYCRYATLTTGDTGYATIGGQEYRTLDLHSEALEIAGHNR